MGKRIGGFDCDRKGKELVADILVKEAEKNGNKLLIDLQEGDDTAGIDIYMSSVTLDGRCILKMSMELKERPDTSSTDCDYWFVEEKKEKKLRDAWQNEGYIPLYGYIFKDGVIAIWDIRTWDKKDLGIMASYPHTYGYTNERKVPRRRWGVSLKSAKRIYNI